MKVSTAKPEIITLSEQLLWQVKMGKLTDNLEETLQRIKMDELVSELNDDAAKKTFWINIYNAFFQILSVKKKKTKPEIFTQKLIIIADTPFSLDDIEHGILRRYRWKLSLGYLPNLFTRNIIKQLSVKKIDFRIHFALNCGAKSCPPIAFYTLSKLENQLETAAFSFLTAETEVDTQHKVVKTSALLKWFIGDFGGKKGIKKALSKYLETDVSDYTIQFKPYDWTMAHHNFIE